MASSMLTNCDNIDWVKEYYECSIDVVFQSLKMEVHNDINKRNDKLPNNQGYKFSMPSNGAPDFFTAMLNAISPARPIHDPYYAIEFIKQGKEIIVRNSEQEMFRATVTLNSQGHCVFKLSDTEELTSWQFRQKALKQLFFHILP